MSIVFVSTVVLTVLFDCLAHKYSFFLSKGLYKVQHGRIINKEPEHYAFNVKDYSVLFEDDSDNIINIPVVTQDYLSATEGSCLIVKWDDHSRESKFGIIMCENNKGWRRASSSEARVVDEHASVKYRERRNSVIVSLVFLSVCTIVGLIAVLFREYSGISVCIIGPITVVCCLVYLLRLRIFPKQVADGNYEVMTGRIIDKSIVKHGRDSTYNLIFENEYGYNLKLAVNNKEYETLSLDRCLVYKLESVGFLKKEDIYVLTYNLQEMLI